MKTIKIKNAAKLVVLLLAVIVFFIGWSPFSGRYQSASASASGPTPSHTNAPGETNCTACHGDFPVNSGPGGILISGLPANYLPGQQIPVTVTVNHFDGVIYGFQLTALDHAGRRAGSMSFPTVTPPVLQTQNGFVNGTERTYLMHTINGVTPSQFGTKSWTFTWTAPPTRAGKISFYAAGNAANSDGGPGGDYIYTTSRATLSGSALANFDSDGNSDISFFRPSAGTWHSLNSTDGGSQVAEFGTNGDRITPGDYDGDGFTDRSVWRPSTGVWYVLKSSGGAMITQFGLQGDVPVPGDYDGDLKCDLAVYRPSTGVWYIFRSSSGTFDIRQFGVAEDKNVQADFDGDGKTDLGVWRPSTGVWYIWRSGSGGFDIFPFGQIGDRPVQNDFDGDGKTDAAVFRPSNGVWYILRSTGGFSVFQFGIATDVPAPADYDGDGKGDPAVFRDGVWYVLRSSDFGYTIVGFGAAGDIPVAAGYLAE